MSTFHNCKRQFTHRNDGCTCSVEAQEAGYWNYLRRTPAEQERMGMYAMPDGYILRGVYQNTTREEVMNEIKTKDPDFWIKHGGTL